MNIYPSSRVIKIAMILSILSGCSDRRDSLEKEAENSERLDPLARQTGSPSESRKKLGGGAQSSLRDGMRIAIADAPGDIDCADLCLSLGKTPSRPGEVVKGEIKWFGLPEGAGLVLFFTRKTHSSSDEYHGPVGAIVKDPQLLPAKGVLQFEWNGQSFACAPLDKMELCAERPAAGTYNITAVVFDRSDFELIGKTKGKAPRRIHGAGSEYFTLTGSPDLKLVAKDLRAGGHRKSASDNKEDAAGTWEDADVRRKGSDWCATFKMKPPGKDRMTVCTPQKSVIDEVGHRQLTDQDIKIIKSF